MLFTRVIFNTCEFTQESLANAKSTRPLFMSENGVVSNIIILNHIGLLKFKNIFLIKELFFISPQLKITLFKPVFLQLALVHFANTHLGNKKSQFIKREANASTY